MQSVRPIAGRRFLFSGATGNQRGTTFISPVVFEALRADQPGTGPKVDGARLDGVSGPRISHAPRSRSGDGEASFAVVEGSSDTDLCDDATAPPERPRADPAGNPAPVRAGLL